MFHADPEPRIRAEFRARRLFPVLSGSCPERRRMGSGLQINSTGAWFRPIPPLMDSVQNGSRRDGRPCKQCVLLGVKLPGAWKRCGGLDFSGLPLPVTP